MSTSKKMEIMSFLGKEFAYIKSMHAIQAEAFPIKMIDEKKHIYKLSLI